MSSYGSITQLFYIRYELMMMTKSYELYLHASFTSHATPARN